MITSTSNPQVKSLIQLMQKARARRERGLYVVEGVRMFREAPADRIEGIYVSESFERQSENRELLDGKRYEVLSDKVYHFVSDTKTPQGILCLVRMREYSEEEVLADENGMWLVLESMQDPGNLGTAFRSGEGAGIAGIILDATTADPYNPKTIRSTMGSIYRVPFLVSKDLLDTLKTMHLRGIRILAAHAEGSACYSEEDYTGATAFLIGNEGNGLSEAALAAADERICIPMRGQLESLNASTAAAILLYEADRQRRQGEV
ncbi:MAG: RNA methyltransferase [Lachnospiraceae bacterium]|nr:RNA methyltransferase [Lachnospiraceae bacterium]